MRTTAILLLVALIAAPAVQARQNKSEAAAKGEAFLDGVVDSKGDTYLLTRSGIKRSDRSGPIGYVPFDVRSTVDGSDFQRWGYHALALDQDDQPAVLWTGAGGKNGAATYVTFLNSRASVKLQLYLGGGFALAIGPKRDLYVLGPSKGQSPLFLVHQFSSDGKHVRSFHPHATNEFYDLDAFQKLGRSRLVATGDSVYLLTPFVSSTVFEYRDGILKGQYNMEGMQAVTIFPSKGKPHVQAVVATKRGVLRSEVYQLEDGHLVPLLSHAETVGPAIGLTPEGRLIERNASVTASRDRLSIR